jgi:hypothetical protein
MDKKNGRTELRRIIVGGAIARIAIPLISDASKRIFVDDGIGSTLLVRSCRPNPNW